MKHHHYRNLAAIVVVVLLVLVVNGKFFFRSTDNWFLLVYGIAVTSTSILLFAISHTRYKDPSEHIIKEKLNAGKKKPFISIVLAAHNEEKIITSCMDALIATDYKKKEIIIVDDRSTDKTLQVLKKHYGSNKLVNIIALKKNVGKKRAIAEGLKVAKGEIYVMTDSDSVIEKTAVSRIIEIFMHDADVGAVSGHGRALNADKNIWTKTQDSWYEGQFSIKKAYESSFGAVSCISGPLAVFRKEAIYNYIPAWTHDTFLGDEFRFATDRTLTSFVLGAPYIGQKLKEKYADSPFVSQIDYPIKEWTSLYCKGARVLTQVPDSFKSILLQHIR